MQQPAPQKPIVETTISIEGKTLEIVNKSTYIVSTCSGSVNIDDEVVTRIVKGSSAFRRLHESVYEGGDIWPIINLKVYQVVTLIYFCDTWTVYERHPKQLSRFHTNCLRKVWC